MLMHDLHHDARLGAGRSDPRRALATRTAVRSRSMCGRKSANASEQGPQYIFSHEASNASGGVYNAWAPNMVPALTLLRPCPGPGLFL